MISRSSIDIFVFLAIGMLAFSDLHAGEIQEGVATSERRGGEASQEQVDFVLRLGEGGFQDSRSPENALGGGQLTLDIKPWKIPLALSVSSEYYTNSPDPLHSYEIKHLLSLNALYDSPVEDIEGLNYFLGGGVGRLEVPRDDDAEKSVTGSLVNLEAGVNYLAIGNIGVYGVVKYLYAQKTVSNKKVIDFNEGIFMLGITFNFSV